MPISADIMACSNLAVSMEVMQHVVSVESAGNPFAIGVVGAKLERQPGNLAEALATAHMLEEQGYNFSIGVSQVNRYNLAKYGLNSYEKAFEPCGNLSAGARILSECYAMAGGDWGKSFSCYYSGNFTKGFEDGYVQKIFDSIRLKTTASPLLAQATPISVTRSAPVVSHSPATTIENAAQYRARIRSSTVDNVASALISEATQGQVPAMASITSADNVAASGKEPQMGGDVISAAADQESAFIPQVSSPTDELKKAELDNKVSKPTSDHADLRLGIHDDAFVF